MQAYAHALPLAFDRVDQPRLRRAVTRSIKDRSGVREFDKGESDRDPYSLYQKGSDTSTIVVATAWLVFYVAAAVGGIFLRCTGMSSAWISFKCTRMFETFRCRKSAT
jgi:hypothetical protein